MKKEWKTYTPNFRLVEKVRAQLNCSPIMAKILVNRRIYSGEKAAAFLNASLTDMRPPFAIKDMDKAVRRIYDAIVQQEKILIFGDYDADGITATTMLSEFLQETGADVSYYIPHRTNEGYGLQDTHISDYAAPNGIQLIITVDCGSSDHKAVDKANELGIDIIITDHHSVPNPPNAFAVINPKRKDCSAGFAYFAGVGVAFALVVSLRKYLRDNGFWQNRPEPNLKNYCDLFALGTVADMVPLIDENRILLKTGLEVINSANRVGLEALLKISGLAQKEADAEDIGFKLAPRLNAAGRMGHAHIAVELLMAKDSRQANQIAGTLDEMNCQRQETEKRILAHILAYLDKNPGMLTRKTLVLAHPEWHEGILGIVASRIVEKYFRPVFLIAAKNGVGKGSGRSVPGVDLYQSLSACSELFEDFGGHAMAAGLQIRTENIRAFREKFELTVENMTTESHYSKIISIDDELDFHHISERLADELETLKPFGTDNPEPLFMAQNVAVTYSKMLNGNHRKMVLRQEKNKHSKSFMAIQFHINPSAPLPEHFEKIAFRVKWNRWQGRKDMQLIIEET